MQIKAFKVRQGRIGKCDCGGELVVLCVESDTVMAVKCTKCNKEIATS